MKIVIVDDNKAVVRTLNLILSPEFGQVVGVTDPTLIPALLRNGDVDAVLLDMNFGAGSLDGKDGIFWLGRIMEEPEPPAVVIMTAFGDLPLAVETMKKGASDFVTKPWDNERLIATLHTAIARNRQQKSERNMARRASELQDAADEREAREKGMSLDDMKQEHMLRTVERCGGNLSEASKILGISRQTLYNQLKKEK